MDNATKQRAKQIIVEIIRQSGGKFHNKTNLYKAFWIAHLSYASATGKILSTWPIVKMPNGPGIDRHEVLLGELWRDGIIDIEQVPVGPFEGFVFHLAKTTSLPQMDEDEAKAVRGGLAFVVGKTAAQVSLKSHEQSISWNKAEIGQEMNLYLDIIPPTERDTLTKEAASFAEFACELVAM